MNENAQIIVTLCSHIDADDAVRPLEPREWSALAADLMKRGLEPSALPTLSEAESSEILAPLGIEAQRFQRLLERAGSLAFALDRLENAGVYVVTRADASYPKRLKRALGNGCPPLFYFSGDIALLNRPAVGFAGSRAVDDDDTRFTQLTVRKVAEQGCGVVSGGAKGVDSIAETTAMEVGSTAVSFLSDSMQRRIKQPQTLRALREGRLLLLSAVNPSAGFSAGTAMMRNRYIYAHAAATVVVRADYNKGGTWNGARDALKHRWSPVLCRDAEGYPGNQALIQQGAIPIDDTWDGDAAEACRRWEAGQAEQLSFL